MGPGDLSEIAAAMAAAGIAGLALAGPGVDLALGRGAAPTPAPPDAEAGAEPVAVTAPGVGAFLRSHPLHDRPLAEAGERVAAGQPVALLQIGALLVPVIVPVAGLIVGATAEDGALVGYGDRLFDLLPQD